MGNHLSLWAQSYCQGGLHTAISWLVKSLARAQSNGVSMITLPRWPQRLQCERHSAKSIIVGFFRLVLHRVTAKSVENAQCRPWQATRSTYTLGAQEEGVCRERGAKLSFLF